MPLGISTQTTESWLEIPDRLDFVCLLSFCFGKFTKLVHSLGYWLHPWSLESKPEDEKDTYANMHSNLGLAQWKRKL